MVGEADIRLYLDRFDKKYWATYKVCSACQIASEPELGPKQLTVTMSASCLSLQPCWPVFSWLYAPCQPSPILYASAWHASD